MFGLLTDDPVLFCHTTANEAILHVWETIPKEKVGDIIELVDTYTKDLVFIDKVVVGDFTILLYQNDLVKIIEDEMTIKSFEKDSRVFKLWTSATSARKAEIARELDNDGYAIFEHSTCIEIERRLLRLKKGAVAI
jgi:hypothetical protein